MSLYGDIKGTHTCNKWQVDIVTSASDQGEQCLYRGFSWVVPMKSWMAYRDYFHLISFQDPLCFAKIVQKPKRSRKEYITPLSHYHRAHITPLTIKPHQTNKSWTPTLRWGMTESRHESSPLFPILWDRSLSGPDSAAWPWSPGAAKVFEDLFEGWSMLDVVGLISGQFNEEVEIGALNVTFADATCSKVLGQNIVRYAWTHCWNHAASNASNIFKPLTSFLPALILALSWRSVLANPDWCNSTTWIPGSSDQFHSPPLRQRQVIAGCWTSPWHFWCIRLWHNSFKLGIFYSWGMLRIPNAFMRIVITSPRVKDKTWSDSSWWLY